MHKIYWNSRGKGYNFESFKDAMIQICNEHRKAKRALAFAFILYNFQNPQILKILEDSDYWRALDNISGEYLTVFSLDYKKEEHPGQKGIQNANMISYITPLGQVCAKGTNVLVEKYFGKDLHVKYPSILFFQVSDNSVIDSLLVSLKEEEIQRAFIELKKHIENAVGALKRIAPECRDNIPEIFNCLAREVKQGQLTKVIKRSARALGDLAALISGIQGLVQ